MILAPRPLFLLCNGSSSTPDESVTRGCPGYRRSPRQLSNPPICIKFEACAFLPNATLPSPMSSVRASVSSASIYGLPVHSKKGVSSLALVPLGHSWLCVVEGRAGRLFDANDFGHTVSWHIPGSWAWPGFPNRGPARLACLCCLPSISLANRRHLRCTQPFLSTASIILRVASSEMDRSA